VSRFLELICDLEKKVTVTGSPGIDDMNEASEIKCKKKLLGLLASWVRLTTCSILVKVRILLRKLVNSKVWNRLLYNNIL
jgi:hypothetical protein